MEQKLRYGEAEGQRDFEFEIEKLFKNAQAV